MNNPYEEEIQRRLKALGYDLGTTGPNRDGVDGDIGRKSRDAAMSALETGKPSAFVEVQPVKPVTGQVDLVLSKQPKALRVITEVIVHCTATPEGRAVAVDTIRTWHKAQGWSDIGYHYVVLLDGRVEEGRPEALIGSHVAGHNTGTLGVVYVGGVDTAMKPKDTRTAGQKATLLELVKGLIKKYPTITKVTGHNQYAAKACPSFDVRNDPLGALGGRRS